MNLSDAYYEQKFETEFLRAKGDAFQTLFERLMGLAYKADFMACRPWGNQGDCKNDGFLKSERRLFQVYAPNEMDAAKATAKIAEDFEGAKRHSGKHSDAWAFVHNATDGLPDVTIKRYDDVQSFHESVIRNRRDYLVGELDAARQRVVAREQEKLRFDERRAAVMRVLQSHGALDQFSQLRGEAGRMEATVESLRQRFEAAEQLEGTKNELEIERNHLTLRLRRDFSGQRARLSAAILAFEETSRRLYESAGSMTVEETSNGPAFQFPMQGSRSKGIKNMQTFCFDMMLMRLCASHGVGPGFLIHDSHLFDGVDVRQLISALKVGAETSQELGFQYIVTMNDDDAFKETVPGFDLRDHVLPTVLTDAMDDGGLFGFRF